MSIDKKVKNSRELLLLCGTVVLVIGLTMILMWWSDVVTVFRGFGGILVALGGMFILYMAKE